MKKYICAILMAVVCSSCGDFLKEYSQDLTRVKTFSDLDELVVGEAFLPVGYVENSTYSLVVHNLNYLPLHFMSDELEENLALSYDPEPSVVRCRKPMFPFFTWQQDTNLDFEGKNTLESQENGYWTMAYKRIASCNMILAEAKNLTAVSADDKVLSNKVQGETYFLRALYYYTLVNLYADPYAPSTAAQTPGVPLKTTEYIEDKEFKRNTVQQVYDQIVSDLTSAEACLKDIPQPTSINRVGINAVYVFRSRIALYMQDWDTAKKYAELSLEKNSKLRSVIDLNAGEAPLSDDSPENIFAMGGVSLGYEIFVHPGGTNDYGQPNSPVFKVSDHLYGLFSDDDARKDMYVSNVYGEGNMPYVTKIDYTDNSFNAKSHISDQFLLRSAEAYLNAAEACAQLGETQNAIKYLDALRATRMYKGANVADLSGNELIKFVRQERERELCFEGQRFYDMRRYAVDANCPEVETVKHSFTTYTYKKDNYYPTSTDVYEMKTNDGALTLNIPKSVRDFQKSIGSNERPVRTPVNTIVYN